MTPADELRAAAATLRNDRNCNNQRLDSNSRELLTMTAALLRAREPLAAVLERAATAYDAAVTAARRVWPDDPAKQASFPADDKGHQLALAVARAVNAARRPGHAQGGPIADRLDPQTLLRDIAKGIQP